MTDLDLKQILTETVEGVEVDRFESSVDEILKAIRLMGSLMSILELYTVTPFGIFLESDTTTTGH
jgi:hypothetical protein